MTFSGTGASMETITVSDGNQNSSGEVFIPGTGVRNFDEDGNLTQDGRWHYLWDAENRLIQMHSVSAVPAAAQRRIEFNYDHAGRRIAKRVYNQVSGGTLLSENKYLYDGWNLIAGLNSSNTATMTYAWGLDMSGTLQGAGGVGGLLLVTDHATGKDHYVDIDGQGSVRRLVDSSDGSLSAEYEYGPFGEPLRATGAMASKNRFRFSTKFDDPETRLLYYGMRYYNPTTGSWISRDPIGERGGLNLYGFVGNDPLNRIDILGLSWISKVKAACKLKNSAELFGEMAKRRKQLEKGIGSLQDHIDEHRQKIIDFTKDPYKFGDGRIIKIPEKHRQGFIDRTLNGWQVEIRAAQKNIGDNRRELAEIAEATEKLKSCSCILIGVLAPRTSELLEDLENGYLNRMDLAPAFFLDVIGIADPGVIDLIDWLDGD